MGDGAYIFDVANLLSDTKGGTALGKYDDD
jgi:hypothetical protein